MQIRNATINDIHEIIQLFYDTVTTVNLHDYNPEQINVWAAARNNTGLWEEKVREQLFVFAEENGIMMGFASLENDGCLDMLYVHKDYQHQGVATRLLKYLELRAREMDLEEIYSDVSITAQPFLKSRGYVVTRENRKKVQGIEFVNAIMRKSIRYPE